MTDYTWPQALSPTEQTYYLQTHTGRSQSPFTKQQKIYELSRPVWITQLTFEGGYAGVPGPNGRNRKADHIAKVSAELMRLKGGANRALIFDFNRRDNRGSSATRNLTNAAGYAGDASLIVNGFIPNSVAFRQGDYIGGDGRCHMVLDTVLSDVGGAATVTFYPPLEANVAAGAAVYSHVTSPFRLVSDDFGAAPVRIGTATTLTIELIEDL